MDEKMDLPPAGDKASEGGYGEIDQAKERKLVRKLDLHIVPVVMLLYLLSFLDRVRMYELATRKWLLLTILQGQHWQCSSLRPGRGP